VSFLIKVSPSSNGFRWDPAFAGDPTSAIRHPPSYFFFPGARLSTFPGRAAVNAPFSTTGTPFTITHGMPTG
jgi:hypothetical protein